jgi:V-type H+-transporting ATPase subunit H
LPPILVIALLKELCRRYDVIPLFISVAQAAAKEKVVRVNIATLRVGFLFLVSPNIQAFIRAL